MPTAPPSWLQLPEELAAVWANRNRLLEGPMNLGPVVITGASGHVGGFVQRWLEDLPNEARPVGHGDNPAIAFAGAEAVIHLAGTLQPVRSNTYDDANVETVRRTVAALEGSSVRRLVFLSYVGASPSSENDYLRTKGEAERLVLASGREAVILRSTFIFGQPDDPGPSATPFISREGKPVSVIGTGKQRYAPVFVGDVAEALVCSALDAVAPTGVFALAGPEELTVDEFADTLNQRHVRKRHLRQGLARVLAHVAPNLTPAMVEVLAADSLADGPLAAETLGIRLHAVADLY